MYKVGDKVRFVTTEPEYKAEYTSEVMTVVEVHDHGDFEVRYPDTSGDWRNGLYQTVSPSDVEPVE